MEGGRGCGCRGTGKETGMFGGSKVVEATTCGGLYLEGLLGLDVVRQDLNSFRHLPG